MKALRETYDFITGGSIVTPIGLACAIVFALCTPAWPAGWHAAVFVAIILATFVMSVYETPT